MRLPNRGRRIVALLALAVIVTGLPSTSRADDEPDLKIEVVGMAPGSDRLVLLKITNVGDARSSDAEATVQTLSPGPSNREEISIGRLDMGSSRQVSYTLDGPCDGHVVRATLNVKKDDEKDNKTAEKQVCDAQAAASSQSLASTERTVQTVEGNGGPNPPRLPATVDLGAVVTEAATIEDLTRQFPGLETQGSAIDTEDTRVGDRVSRPEHLRMGRHTISRQPVTVRRLWVRYAGQGSASGPRGACVAYERPGADADPETLMVGYEHVSGGCVAGVIYQTAFKFDFSDLYQFTSTASAGALEVVRADLAWDNEPGVHRSDAGVPGGDRSCIGRIGLLFPGPQHNLADQRGLIADYELYAGVIYKSHEVPDFRVERMMRYPSDNNGFLLRGSEESLFEADNSACISRVSNVKLTVTYDIFE